jgi:Cu+-exporting ATPase
MGMPMRPAMSVMETTETPPVSPHDAGVTVTVAPAAGQTLRAGVPVTLTVTVRDATSGDPVDDLVRTHQQWAHMVLTRTDLATFAHIHPMPGGTAGQLHVTATFPTPGTYFLHTEFRRQGQMTNVLDRTTVTVPGTQPADTTKQSPSSETRTATARGVTVTLTGDAVVADTSDLTLSFTDATTGAPVTGLRPYLGAAGHVVILRNDGTRFAHAHAETTDAAGRPVFAVPGKTFGPRLSLHPRFETSGTYRLWGQFRLPDSIVITVPFTLHPHHRTDH